MLFIGEVEYHSRQEIENFLRSVTFRDLASGGQNDKFARTMLVKRLEFTHEKEVRLLFHDADNVSTGWVLNFPFPYSNILQEAVLDPRLEKDEFERRKKDLESLGCSIPIKQSELYKIDEIEIPIE